MRKLNNASLPDIHAEHIEGIAIISALLFEEMIQSCEGDFTFQTLTLNGILQAFAATLAQFFYKDDSTMDADLDDLCAAFKSNVKNSLQTYRNE